MIREQLVILHIFEPAKEAVMVVNVPVRLDQIGGQCRTRIAVFGREGGGRSQAVAIGIMRAAVVRCSFSSGWIVNSGCFKKPWLTCSAQSGDGLKRRADRPAIEAGFFDIPTVFIRFASGEDRTFQLELPR